MGCIEVALTETVEYKTADVPWGIVQPVALADYRTSATHEKAPAEYPTTGAVVMLAHTLQGYCSLLHARPLTHPSHDI